MKMRCVRDDFARKMVKYVVVVVVVVFLLRVPRRDFSSCYGKIAYVTILILCIDCWTSDTLFSATKIGRARSSVLGFTNTGEKHSKRNLP